MPPSITAMPSSEVAMGRWMKGDETLMAGRYSLDFRSALPFALALHLIGGRAAVRSLDRHVLALPEPAEAAGHHDLAGAEPFADRGLLVVLQLDPDLPHRHRIVAAHRIDKSSRGPALH